MISSTSDASRRFSAGYADELAKIAADEKPDLKKFLIGAGTSAAGTAAGIVLGAGILHLLRKYKPGKLALIVK